MLKPGRNSTSFPPAWNHGKTQTIRVPIALAEQILEYAYAVDSGHVMDQFPEVAHTKSVSTKSGLLPPLWG